MQGLHVLGLDLFVVEEHVVEGAVDDGVEPILQAVEPGRIGHLEVHPYPCAFRVALGLLYRRQRRVDPGGRVSLGCVVDRVMSRAGSGIEHLAPHSAVCDQLLHHGLWAADVQGTGTGVPCSGDPSRYSTSKSG